VQFVLCADHSFDFGVAPWFSSGLPGRFLVSFDFLLDCRLEVGKVVVCCVWRLGTQFLADCFLHVLKDFVLIPLILVSGKLFGCAFLFSLYCFVEYCVDREMV